jgi:hypothetical protein
MCAFALRTVPETPPATHAPVVLRVGESELPNELVLSATRPSSRKEDFESVDSADSFDRRGGRHGDYEPRNHT